MIRIARRRFCACTCVLVALLGVGGATADTRAAVEIGYRVVATYPHDRLAYTQGLVFAGGALYESTGLYGRSTVRRVDLKTGRADLVRSLAPHQFGEGLTAFGDRLIQLTWRSGAALVYARRDIRRHRRCSHPRGRYGSLAGRSTGIHGRR